MCQKPFYAIKVAILGKNFQVFLKDVHLCRDEIRIIIIRIYSRIFTEMKIRIINLNIRIFERLLICHFPPKIGLHTSNFSAKL